MGRLMQKIYADVVRDENGVVELSGVGWYRRRTLVELLGALGLIASTIWVFQGDDALVLFLRPLRPNPDVGPPLLAFAASAFVLAFLRTRRRSIGFEPGDVTCAPFGYAGHWFARAIPGGHENVLRFAFSGKGRRYVLSMNRRDGSSVPIETRLNYFEACRLQMHLNDQLVAFRRAQRKQASP